MIEYVHEHIIEEMKTNTRTDTIFVLASILLNLISLAVNSAAAESDETNLAVMFVFTALILVVNSVAIVGLLKGRQTRSKLVEGLLKMYQDKGVDGYYDTSLLGAYRNRYVLFLVVVISSGIVGLIVPFLLL